MNSKFKDCCFRVRSESTGRDGKDDFVLVCAGIGFLELCGEFMLGGFAGWRKLGTF